MKKIIPVLLIVIIIAALISCEPAGWDVIMAPPAAATSFTVDSVSLITDLTLEVTLGIPFQQVWEMNPGIYFEILGYYRLETESKDQAVIGCLKGSLNDQVRIDSEVKDSEQSTQLTFDQANFINGNDYIFSVSLIDPESQVSELTDAAAVTVSW